MGQQQQSSAGYRPRLILRLRVFIAKRLYRRFTDSIHARIIRRAATTINADQARTIEDQARTIDKQLNSIAELRRKQIAERHAAEITGNNREQYWVEETNRLREEHAREIKRKNFEIDDLNSRIQIQDNEIKQLAAVIVRDRERVEAETAKFSQVIAEATGRARDAKEMSGATGAMQ